MLDVDQFVEVVFTNQLQSRVGVWLNPALGNALFTAFDSNGQSVGSVVGTAGNFVGVELATAQIRISNHLQRPQIDHRDIVRDHDRARLLGTTRASPRQVIAPTAPTRDGRTVLVLCIALATSGCTSADQRLQQVAKTLSSLAATTQMACHAWIDGDAATAYTLVTLDRTRQLIEAQRSELVGSPALRAHPRGAQLTTVAEQLQRSLSSLGAAVERGDGEAVRREMTDLPGAPPSRP